jgi:hypothetical protein
MDKYKKHIYKTIDALEEIEIMLFTSMLNLASEGELKEISDTFEINDVVKFKLEDFQNLEDANINLLMNIFNDVLSTRDKLENLYPQCKSKKEDDELPF